MLRDRRLVGVVSLLLARGRDRLETNSIDILKVSNVLLLLARGRDRLETEALAFLSSLQKFSYSLGDAIDWKPDRKLIAYEDDF